MPEMVRNLVRFLLDADSKVLLRSLPWNITKTNSAGRKRMRYCTRLAPAAPKANAPAIRKPDRPFRKYWLNRRRPERRKNKAGVWPMPQTETLKNIGQKQSQTALRSAVVLSSS